MKKKQKYFVFAVFLFIILALMVFQLRMTGKVITTSQENGLVVYYALDENSGSLIYDGSGNKLNADISGTDWISGMKKSALKFEQGYLEMAKFPINSSDSTLSFMFWENSPKYSDKQTFVSDQTSSTKEGFIFVYRGMDDNSLNFEYSYQDAGTEGTGKLVFNGFFNDSDNLWTHVAVVADYKTGNVKVYKNGLMFKEEKMSGEPRFPYASRGIYLASYGKTNYQLSGSLDEFKIFNRTLSDAEIKDEVESAGVEVKIKTAGNETNLTNIILICTSDYVKDAHRGACNKDACGNDEYVGCKTQAYKNLFGISYVMEICQKIVKITNAQPSCPAGYIEISRESC